MAGITRQSDPPGQYRGERYLMDRFSRCTHRPTKRRSIWRRGSPLDGGAPPGPDLACVRDML